VSCRRQRTTPGRCYCRHQVAGDGERRQEERALDDDSILDEGVETSITDEVDSDLDLIASSKKGTSRDPYIEQDN
jgi:hypothetical protein